MSSHPRRADNFLVHGTLWMVQETTDRATVLLLTRDEVAAKRMQRARGGEIKKLVTDGQGNWVEEDST